MCVQAPKAHHPRFAPLGNWSTASQMLSTITGRRGTGVTRIVNFGPVCDSRTAIGGNLSIIGCHEGERFAAVRPSHPRRGST